MSFAELLLEHFFFFKSNIQEHLIAMLLFGLLNDLGICCSYGCLGINMLALFISLIVVSDNFDTSFI